jgi:hypothetical protein
MVAALVAHAGRQSMRAVAAVGSTPARPETCGELEGLAARPPDLVVRSDRAGAIQAVHETGPVRWAERRDCVLVQLHPAGGPERIAVATAAAPHTGGAAAPAGGGPVGSG